MSLKSCIYAMGHMWLWGHLGSPGQKVILTRRSVCVICNDTISSSPFLLLFPFEFLLYFFCEAEFFPTQKAGHLQEYIPLYILYKFNSKLPILSRFLMNFGPIPNHGVKCATLDHHCFQVLYLANCTIKIVFLNLDWSSLHVLR